MNTNHNQGFTLIELLLAVAILTVLASVAVYNVSSGDKISQADELVLKQALLSYIPEQIKHYYLRGDSVAWTNKVVQIQNEMADWPQIDGSQSIASVYKSNGLELKFKTIHQDTQRNEELANTLTKFPLIEAVRNQGQHKQQFTVQYKLN